MNITVTEKAKSSAVAIGAFRIFGEDKKVLLTDAERVKRFDTVWQRGLNFAIERAIKEQKTIQPSMVEEMLQRQFWRKGEKAAAFLNVNKSHYQFTFEVLCVVQTEYIEKSDEHIIDQLWSFTFPDALPERFCFQFDKLEDKEYFESFAQSQGQDPKDFAKRAIMERVENIKHQRKLIEIQRRNLAHCIIQKTQLGLHTPPYVINQMQESREDIQRIKQILRDWGVQIEDHPDDNTYP